MCERVCGSDLSPTSENLWAENRRLWWVAVKINPHTNTHTHTLVVEMQIMDTPKGTHK